MPLAPLIPGFYSLEGAGLGTAADSGSRALSVPCHPGRSDSSGGLVSRKRQDSEGDITRAPGAGRCRWFGPTLLSVGAWGPFIQCEFKHLLLCVGIKVTASPGDLLLQSPFRRPSTQGSRPPDSQRPLPAHMTKPWEISCCSPRSWWSPNCRPQASMTKVGGRQPGL